MTTTTPMRHDADNRSHWDDHQPAGEHEPETTRTMTRMRDNDNGGGGQQWPGGTTMTTRRDYTKRDDDDNKWGTNEGLCIQGH
jgi:hypothetical protein